MSFLFAAQLRLRRTSYCERRRLLGGLEPNQRGYVRAAMRHPPPDALAARLLERPEQPPITTAR